MASDRWQFLSLATLFEGGLTVLALVLAWLMGVPLLDQFHVTTHAVTLGVVSTVPMLAVFLVTYRFPVGPFRAIKQFLLDALGPALSRCHWYDLVWVAALAGFSEELLFRGVFQHWSGQLWNGWFGWCFGLVTTNILFGLAHAITPLYAVLAGLLGAYLGVLYTVEGTGNLIAPIICHSLYDLIAFFIVRQSVLSRNPRDGSNPARATDPESSEFPPHRRAQECIPDDFTELQAPKTSDATKS